MVFNHLHVHSQYSLLDGAASIPAMYKKAADDGMRGLALTDHGNMFGVFSFVAEASKHAGIKPIVGCEFYMVENRHKKAFTKDDKDVRYHQLLLAKNPEGYKNLVKLCSLGFIDGLYGKYPRIDKELLLKHHKGLIATTCCLGAVVPRTILRKGEEAGEKEFLWWLDLFGEDYFVELQRHGIPDQDKANEILVKFARKHNVPIIASNDSHYVDQKDSNAHDILLCINTGEKASTPKAKDFDEENPMAKGSRFAFYNDQFYFKTTEEMTRLFHDLPESIDNTNIIVDRVEPLKLKQDILLPNFEIPKEFMSQDDFLFDMTYKGAKERYKDITPEIKERLDFELGVIKTMGFAGYFLIVQDFINKGKEIGVFVGPGRGSAAGSAVAYCIGITNIDPIKYNLLFERFLNPDRKSMPDIDTDFDDEGRDKVIKYVVEKYTRNQVAQIVTYSTMAAKVSIKDVSRVLDLPLADANILAKLVPEKPGISLKRVLEADLVGDKSLSDKEGLNSDEIEMCRQLREYAKGNNLQAQVLKEALVLEGSVRGTGIHAAGIIIAPMDLSDIIPVCTNKDSDLLITQYEGKIIEDAGVIKMDFLGLKTLTIIRDALKMIKENHGVEFDIDSIPLDDAKTFALYQRAETNATFQFESAGMQKYLRELKPDKFEDLIAMNALYRPGPLEYIPTFIRRKLGLEKVVYDLPEMEEHLQETFGISVYQEQIMLLSQKLAGFTKGQADVLRKAMGKKDRATLDKMKGVFIEGASAKGLDAKVLEKVWTDWEAFAAYAFNKSHSTCYAFVAYQTGFLKAHYPAEFMASVLTHNLSNMDKLTFFMEECKRMGLKVLGPDVNESVYNFGVNKKGEIRFGLGAIKGVGEGPVEEIIRARKACDGFKNIFDFIKNVAPSQFNKRVGESLVYAGALDALEGVANRASWFAPTDEKGAPIVMEALMRWGAAVQKGGTSSGGLFGEDSSGADIPAPKVPSIPEWNLMEKLNQERAVVGIYLSGHPLDDFKLEITQLCTSLATMDNVKDKEFAIAGIVTSAMVKVSAKGSKFGIFMLEDFGGSKEFRLFGESFLKYEHFLKTNEVLYIKGKNAPRWGSDTETEFKVSSMQQLGEVRSAAASKNIQLRIPVTMLSPALIEDMDAIFKQNEGTSQIKMHLYEETTKLMLPLRSNKYRVKVSSELLTALERLGLDCKLN